MKAPVPRLEQHPLLRIHPHGLSRRDSKACVVKQLGTRNACRIAHRRIALVVVYSCPPVGRHLANTVKAGVCKPRKLRSRCDASGPACCCPSNARALVVDSNVWAMLECLLARAWRDRGVKVPGNRVGGAKLEDERRRQRNTRLLLKLQSKLNGAERIEPGIH